MPYGFHKKFAQSFNLITTLREPYERIVSRYRYHCNLKKKLPNKADFQSFYRDVNQCDHQVKLLCGDVSTKIIDEKSLTQAKENLNDFYAYTTIKKMNILIEIIISVYQLPSVFGQKNNVSPEWAKLNWSEFQEEILSLNQFDSLLFKYVDDNDRLPSLNLSDEDSAHEAILNTQERSESNRFSNYIYQTSELMNTIRSQRINNGPITIIPNIQRQDDLSIPH